MLKVAINRTESCEQHVALRIELKLPITSCALISRFNSSLLPRERGVILC